MPNRADTDTDPGRQAARNVEQARALLLGAADLVRVATPLQVGAPGDPITNRIDGVCDVLASKLTLKFPLARRRTPDRVLP